VTRANTTVVLLRKSRDDAPSISLYLPGAMRQAWAASSNVASRRGSTSTSTDFDAPAARSTLSKATSRFGASQPPATGEA